MRKWMLVAVAIALLDAGSSAEGACVGPEQRAVQKAINNASAGDTVLVCAGSATWTTTRPGSSAVVINKAITLQGATTCTGSGATLSCTDGTIINDGTGTKNGESIIGLAVSNARLTGFSLNDPRSVTDYKAMVDTAVGTSNWRIDHCKLTMSAPATRGISAFGYGLIDHVYVGTSINTAFAIEGNSPGDPGGSLGDGSWAAPMAAGTVRAVYIEDSKIVFTPGNLLNGVVDSYAGGRYVYRFNDDSYTNLGNHGLDSTSNARGALQSEVYHNSSFNGQMSSIYQWFNSRGGSHFIFNNVLSRAGAGYTNKLDFRVYRASGAYPPWGACDGKNGLDGNTPGEHGYACRDQVGRGTNQGLYPGFSWSNRYGEALLTVADIWISDGVNNPMPNKVSQHLIIHNRDFYNEVDPFTGGSGIGVGLFADAPATCTAGVGYWATDKGFWNNRTSGIAAGALFRCATGNTWEPYYVPFQYPHPLQGELSVRTDVK